MREENEDSFGSLELPDGWLLTVCDGMGGYAGGKIASQTAVDTLLAFVKERFDADRIPDILKEGIAAANDAVRAKAKSDSKLGEMGTTCVALIADKDRYFVAHVGDSRAYHFRSGVFTLLSEDHTVVQQLVRQGRVTPLEATNHPSAGILVRCLGQLDVVEAEISGPHELLPGDRLLLCSDGLSGMLYEDDIGRVLTSPGLEEAVHALIRYANDAGGFDNITALVLQADPFPEDSLSFVVRVESPEGRALAEAEARQQASPAISPDTGQTQNTLIMTAINPDDTRELALPSGPSWEPGSDRWRKIAIAALVFLALGGIAALLALR
jgi:protein phosphatase